MANVSSRVRIGALLTMSMAVLLMLVMTHASPAQAQATSTVRVSNLGQPSVVRFTGIGEGQSYAQSFCTGAVATTLDKVRIYTMSVTAEGNPEGYTDRAAPVVTIRSDSSGKPGQVLHTLSNPVIDLSIDTAEDFTSSGYELAASTTYWVVIHRTDFDDGHIAFLHTTSPAEDTETELGWSIGDQYLYTFGWNWADDFRQGNVMKMAIYASGDPSSLSTPAFADWDGTGSSSEFSVDENAAGNTVVGTALALDADGDSLTYSVSGTGAAKFNNVFDFDTATGEITVKPGASIDYESSDKSYSVTVSVTDGEDASGNAETDPTIDATISVRINVIDVNEPGFITLSVTTPEVGSVLRARLYDQDGGSLLYKAQWSRAVTAAGPFVDIDGANDHHLGRADSYYTPTAADQGKYLKVTMSYFEYRCGVLSSLDDRCRKIVEKTSDNAVPEGQSSDQQALNTAATGVIRITGSPRVGGTLTANRSNVRDADGLTRTSIYRFQWIRHDPVTEFEENVQGPENSGVWSSYVVTDADVDKAIKVRMSFTDDAGNAESLTSDAVAVSGPRSTPNPLTAAIHDAPEFHDGATEFTFELRFSEEPGGGFSATALRDQALMVSGGAITNVRQLETGKNLKWEITAQPSGNEEVIVMLLPTIDCAAQGAICTGDGRILSVALAILVMGPQNSAATGAPTINGTAQVGETLTASTSGISDADGLTNASFTYQWLADDADVNGATTSSYTLVAADAGKTIKVRVSFTDDEGNEESVTSAATAAVTQPPLTAGFHDEPSSHDGSAEFTFELRFSEEPAAGFGFATVRDHALTVTAGSMDNVRRLEPGKNAKWEITVTPDSDADVTIAVNATTNCSAEGAICSAYGMKLVGGLELVVPGPSSNSAAAGAPTISGTAQVGETLTALTSGISDADGVANASFTYQWLADDADISGATTSSYTLVAADAGKTIKVRVSFTDDAGNEESVTSNAVAASAPPVNTDEEEQDEEETVQMTAGFHDAPESHDGSDAFTFELRFSEAPKSDFSYATVRNHAFTVTEGSVSNVRRLEPGKNVKWEITVTPDSNADVTIALNATTDCSAEGAICTGDGRKLSGDLELVVPGPSSEQAVQENSAAAGAPTISGTAQAGETLTALTSDISDADGLANASFTYQWLADDTEIDGATGSSYTLADTDVGKAIKVRVSFTDDEGNEESVTSAATGTVAAAPSPLTASIHNAPDSHGGSDAFTFELRFSENMESFSYTTLKNHALTVTGGTLPKVRRLEPGKNVRWEITVQPSSNADVTIVLPITTDCTVQGAICTSDGRKLSDRVEVTISGPGG